MSGDKEERFRESARKGRREVEIRMESAALDAAAELLSGETVYIGSVEILRLVLDNLPEDHLPEVTFTGSTFRVWYTGVGLEGVRRALAAENLLSEVQRRS